MRSVSVPNTFHPPLGLLIRGPIIHLMENSLWKFHLCSASLAYRKTQGRDSEQFLQSLRELLTLICDMMSLECKENELIAPRAQAQSLQFLPQTFDLLLLVMSFKSLGLVCFQTTIYSLTTLYQLYIAPPTLLYPLLLNVDT